MYFISPLIGRRPSRLAMLLGMLLAGSVLCTAGFAQQTTVSPDDSSQLWFGVIDAGVLKLRVKLDIEKAESGAWSGEMVSLDQGNAKIPLETIQVTGGTMEFATATPKGKFSGKLNEQRTEAKGTWKQQGKDMPLTLNLVDEVPAEEVPTTVWLGMLDAKIMKLEVQFRLFEKEGEETRVLFDSLTQRTRGLAAEVEEDGNKIVFKVPAIMAKYEATLSADHSSMEGTWKQGPQLLSLSMDKVEREGKVAAEPERPQHPKAPYPYREEFHKVPNTKAEIELAGTLTLPKQTGKYPAVILISGSGPQDRDETLMDHKPFLVIADHLTRNGIAVFRFDDRGVGESTGDFDAATTKDFASDVYHIVKFLRKHDEIDSNRVGLVGHSEGGLIAPLVASKMHGKLAHIVLLAGPGVDGGDILSVQGEAIARASGIDEAEIAEDAELGRRMVAAIRNEVSEEEFQVLVEELTNEMSTLDSVQNAEERAQEASMLKMAASRFTTPWFRFFINYDPVPALRNAGCPVLSLIGEKDLQVLVSQNHDVIENTLKESGNPDYRCVVLEGLNHLFQTCETGSPMEYQSIEETFSPTALKEITDWVLKH